MREIHPKDFLRTTKRLTFSLQENESIILGEVPSLWLFTADDKQEKTNKKNLIEEKNTQDVTEYLDNVENRFFLIISCHFIYLYTFVYIYIRHLHVCLKCLTESVPM